MIPRDQLVDVRTEIAALLMAGYLASPQFKFDELSMYAEKARIATDILLKEMRENPGS